MLPSTKYTVIYTTSPVSQRHHLVEDTEPYEMDRTFGSPAHMELKRDLSAYKRNASHGNTALVDGPLFERYQFFGPGILQILIPNAIMERSLTIIRSLYGYSHHAPPSSDSLRRDLRCLKSTGVLRCFR